MGALALALVFALTISTAPAKADRPLSTDSTIIGQTVRGRPIEIACVGAGRHRVLVVGGVHTGPDEAITVDLADELARRVWFQRFDVPDDVTLCILPALNIDGLRSDDHRNARGVDLNRNWPTENWATWAYHSNIGRVRGGAKPLSEPETRALYRYIEQRKPNLIVTYHCCGPLVEPNHSPLAARLGRVYASSAGYWYLEDWTFYEITGQMLDSMDDLGVPAIDIEMRSREEMDAGEHVEALHAVLEALAED